MSNENRGTALLSCRAYLHNGRDASHAANAMFVDAVIIPVAPIGGFSPVTCCLFYGKTYPEDDIPPGVYDVIAKVSTFIDRKVHLSPDHEHVRYAFLGNIIQLRALDLSADQPVGHSDVPARFTASGRVIVAEENVPAFLTTIVLNPYPGAPLAHITLRGLLPVHSGCGRPFRRVPQVGAFVSFTGVILAMENDVPTITIDDLALLPQNSAFVINVASADSDDAVGGMEGEE